MLKNKKAKTNKKFKRMKRTQQLLLAMEEKLINTSGLKLSRVSLSDNLES